MTMFHLVRHGDKVRAKGDVSLTEIGKEQAKKTAKYFKNKKITAIFSSPLTRTKQTAQTIASELGLEYATEYSLRERMNWGDIEDQSVEEFMHEWNKADADHAYIPPGGQSSEQAGTKAKKLLSQIVQQYPQEEVILVTHGGLIGDLLHVLFPEKAREVDKKLPLQVWGRIAECSITTLTYQDGKYELICVGDIAHL